MSVTGQGKKLSLKAINAIGQKPCASHAGWDGGKNWTGMGVGVMPKKKKKKRGY